MSVLVVNAGSSSLKLSVLDDGDHKLADAQLPAPRGELDQTALADAIAGFPAVSAVGHRIVHGGREFRGPARLTSETIARLEELSDLAPLHQAKSLQALAAASRVLPDVTAVACFDTAFHFHLPEAAATYALPREWRDRFAVRRYGFHGLSHAYASRRAAELLGRAPESLRIVSCHLGAGASLAAVRAGRSIDTTMGFTPLEGLVMSTRSGTVDPGLVLWLLEHADLSPAQLADNLENNSGLAALAGTGEMGAVVSDARSGGVDARLALGVYVHRLAGGIAAMAASMGGLDALAFTGGVGENVPEIRVRAAERLRFLGLAIEAALNDRVEGDADISDPDAKVRTLVIRAREDLEIARQVRDLLASDG